MNDELLSFRLENESSEFVTSKKITGNIVANNNISSGNKNFGKIVTITTTMRLIVSQYLKTFLIRFMVTIRKVTL